MSPPIYEKGTIKVVWIEQDPERIYSKMFEDEKIADKFAKSKKDYIIFALVKQENMEEFEWVLLPYGHHDLYKKLLRYYQKHKHNIGTLLRLLPGI